VTTPLPAGIYNYYAQSTNFFMHPRIAITVTVTDCTSLKDISGSNVAKLYPNPSSGVFYVKILSEINSLQVYASNGTLVKMQKTKNVLNLSDLSEQENGIYLFKLMSKRKVISVKKALVEHTNR